MSSLLRQYVLAVHAEVTADPVTAAAAFGVCCSLIRAELGCSLKVAVWLLECWLQEREKPQG